MRSPTSRLRRKLLSRKLGPQAKRFAELRIRFQQEGDADALREARRILEEATLLPLEDQERLFGYAEGSHRVILPERAALLTTVSRMPGLDGRRMAKSYGNSISLREEPESVTKKIRTMPTDPARVRRTDPGEPELCPVWPLHLVYSDEATKQWVQTGCRTAGIGCLECKQPVIDAVVRELAPLRERAQAYLDDPTLVRDIVANGCDKARAMAGETMRDVRAPWVWWVACRSSGDRRAVPAMDETHDLIHEQPSAWVTRWSRAIAPASRVLDVACGRGRHARLLAAQGCKVTAVDRDPAILEMLRDTNSRLSSPILSKPPGRSATRNSTSSS